MDGLYESPLGLPSVTWVSPVAGQLQVLRRPELSSPVRMSSPLLPVSSNSALSLQPTSVLKPTGSRRFPSSLLPTSPHPPAYLLVSPAWSL